MKYLYLSIAILLCGLNAAAHAPANLTISDGPTYDFGTVAVGGMTEHAFTVTNTGSHDATGLEFQGLTEPFAYLDGDCEEVLVAGASCTIVATYSPTSIGVDTDTIEIAYYSRHSQEHATRNVLGIATFPAILTITPEAYDFGSTAVGSNTTQIIKITNSGGYATSAMSESGLGAPFGFAGGAYPGIGGNCGTYLAAGTSCILKIEFSPATVGLFSDTIQLNYFDGVSAITVTSAIQGTGSFPAVLTISDGPIYDFGSVNTGHGSEHTFTVTNSGGIPATAMIGSGLASPFAFHGGAFPGVSGTCGATLAAGASCTFSVVYYPSFAGSHDNDTIDISYNDGISAQTVTRAITGNAN